MLSHLTISLPLEMNSLEHWLKGKIALESGSIVSNSRSDTSNAEKCINHSVPGFLFCMRIIVELFLGEW